MDIDKLSFIQWITLNGTTYYLDENYLETLKKNVVVNSHNEGHTNIEIDEYDLNTEEVKLCKVE